MALHWSKDGTVTEWNPTFAAVMLDLGVGVEVCWPARGNQKGSVENLVGWVKGSFFKQRRFLDEADLLAQLAAWHEEVNTQTPCRATGVPPAARMAEERARLRPLKVVARGPGAAHPGLGRSDRVRAPRHPPLLDAARRHRHRRHALPLPGPRPDRGWRASPRTHPRLFERNAKSTLPEHRAEAVAEVSGKRGKRYLKREHLLEVGGDALDYLTEITHRRPGAWIGEVEQLHELLQQHGADALRVGPRAALSRARPSAPSTSGTTSDHLEPPPLRQEVLPL